MKYYHAGQKLFMSWCLSLIFYNETVSLLVALHWIFLRNRDGWYKYYNRPREALIRENIDKTRDDLGRENTSRCKVFLLMFTSQGEKSQWLSKTVKSLRLYSWQAKKLAATVSWMLQEDMKLLSQRWMKVYYSQQ